MPWDKIVALIALLLSFVPTILAIREEIIRKEKFFTCLRNKNVKFIGSCSCSRCENQRTALEMKLGSKFLEGIYVEAGHRYILDQDGNYVLDQNGKPITEPCPNYDHSWSDGLSSGTHNFPIWKFPNGEITEGVIYNYNELAQKTGCPY